MTKTSWWLAGSAATAVALVATPAFACGGFFCNTGAPVNQTGEQILFAVEDGQVEAIVGVQYAGPSEEFAWIVPTPSRPEVDVSSNIIFSRLDQLLRAQFYAQWFYDGDCGWDFAAEDGAAAGGGPPSPSPDADGRGVTVVEQSQVGPYDYAVLQATSVEPLFEWLRTNDYDLPPVIEPFVEPYVLMEDDVHFVAFKLSKDSDDGDIAPIVLRYESDEPMIPIQLTAVATVPDMGVTVHLVGPHRAVPENFLHVTVNEARIDWLNNGSNYNALVTAAMDEAGGQGFATEFAGPSSGLADAFWREGAFDAARLEGITDPIAFWGVLQEMLMNMGLRGDATILELLETFIPIPEELAASGVQAQDFYNCLECYRESIDADGFNGPAFIEAVVERIVEPLEHAQGLFDRIPYTTRLYTTLSAEEMTIDPYFTFNPDMGDVANVRYVEAHVECDPDVEWSEQRVRIVLPDGTEVYQTMGGERGDLDALPAASAIAETGASGPEVIVEDRTDRIQDELARHNDQFARLVRGNEERAGCSAGGTAAAGWLLAPVVGALVTRRRRSLR